MISYFPFWRTLEEKEISTYTLIQKYGIAPTTIQRLRTFEYVSLRTLDELCQILGCRIQDIVEILPDDFNDPNIKKLNSRQKCKYKKQKDRP